MLPYDSGGKTFSLIDAMCINLERAFFVVKAGIRHYHTFVLGVFYDFLMFLFTFVPSTVFLFCDVVARFPCSSFGLSPVASPAGPVASDAVKIAEEVRRQCPSESTTVFSSFPTHSADPGWASGKVRVPRRYTISTMEEREKSAGMTISTRQTLEYERSTKEHKLWIL